MPRNYDIEDSDLIIMDGKGGTWAVYDASRTVDSRFIAVRWELANPNTEGWEHEIITMFHSIEELLSWAARRKANGAVFRTGRYVNGKELLLEKLCKNSFWDSFDAYCAEQSDTLA
jgi:hypothetical protein